MIYCTKSRFIGVLHDHVHAACIATLPMSTIHSQRLLGSHAFVAQHIAPLVPVLPLPQVDAEAPEAWRCNVLVEPATVANRILKPSKPN